MISNSINLSTGPINISQEVKQVLHAAPISHRSTAFIKLFNDTQALLCNRFAVRQAFIMTGSGTLANEAMLYQIKAMNTKGLIISNGEFGSRLIYQAKRISLNFEAYETEWGQPFNLHKVDSLLAAADIQWLLFCHNETSTGVLNDLDALAALCVTHHCFCFADCISSAGTVPLNLMNVSMATASSGKGLACSSGLALVLSNMQPKQDSSIPLYYDISYYEHKEHVPFTISSNLIHALNVSIQQKLTAAQFDLARQYSERFFTILNEYELVPFGSANARVFTIVTPNEVRNAFIARMTASQVILSHESEYLKKRGWVQLAVLGYYSQEQLEYTYKALQQNLRQPITKLLQAGRH
jgi:aspartate aminotransferase-like enzyme